MEPIQYFTISVIFAATVISLIFFKKLKTMKSSCKQLQEKNDEIMEKTKKSYEELASIDIEAEAARLKTEAEEIQKVIDQGRSIYETLMGKLKEIKPTIESIKNTLYPPTYAPDDSEDLKQEVNLTREKQLKLIKKGDATLALSNWTWFDSAVDGSTMVEGYRYLVLRAFNCEFDTICKQMRVATFGKAEEKLAKLKETLTNLGETTNVSINGKYYNAKFDELRIWHNELLRKEEQKEEARRQRETLKQQATQISHRDDDEENDVEEEIYACKKELEAARAKASFLVDRERAKVELQIEAIEEERMLLEARFERTKSRAQSTRAGYVYVISNVGSFGKGVLKIGMTRRLEPMDRVKELGDASVPFRFDVHAMVFVHDAPSLEKVLHKKFSNRRVNIDNHRKEFFRVDVSEVKAALKEIGIDSDWYFETEAREYRESSQMRAARQENFESLKRESQDFPETV
jgi:hypothetical protein